MSNQKRDNLESLKEELGNKVEDIAKRKPILDAHKQRVVWARLTTIKRILIKRGLTTDEEFEAMASAMVRDIDKKVLENIKKELGL